MKNATAKVREQSNSIGSAFGKLAKFAGFAILGKKLLDVGRTKLATIRLPNPATNPPYGYSGTGYSQVWEYLV